MEGDFVLVQKKKPVFGLTLGEAPGIGPELVVKALQDEEVRSLATWVIIGDERVYQQGAQIAKASLDYVKVDSSKEVGADRDIWMIDLGNLDPATYELGKLSPASGKVTGETLKYGLKLAQDKKLDGLVYAPLNKEALQRGGHHFEDEIHFFAELLHVQDGFGEINVMDNLWLTRLTSHIPLKEVSQHITKENVLKIIRFAHGTLTQAGIENPRIAVAGLNPHAGEGGLIGREEIDEILPAVQEAQQQGMNAHGPYPADTIFLRLDKEPFDCMVSMYHDQGQTGMKLLGFHKGVTVSGGLPVVLTTPAHGTAFDIAGKGIADPGAMRSAMKLAVRLAGY